MRKFYCVMAAKKILVGLFSLFLIQSAKAQPTVIYGDFALGSFDITTLSDNPVNANALLQNTVYKLKLSVVNLDQVNIVPDGSAYIQIGLGSKMAIDAGFNLATAPYNNYFTWTSSNSGGQTQIYGTIHTPLPPDFQAVLSFNIRSKPSAQGPSFFSGNFSVSNNNPAYVYSDLNSSNNLANLSYSLSTLSPVPVTITQFGAVNRNCQVNVNWAVEQELNFSHYEVEMSKDGINYSTVATVAAQNRPTYSTNVAITDALRTNILYVRLKCVDLDGTFKYTKIVTVSGNCNSNATGIYSYPNPVRRDGEMITIVSSNGTFNGNYNLILSDIGGRIYSSKTINLINVVSFKYEVGALPAKGQYMLRIQRTDGSESNLVRFEKL